MKFKQLLNYYYHNDKLYRIILVYAHFMHLFFPSDYLALPYETAVELLDGSLKDKFLSDGRIHYNFLNGSYYYKGNTRICIEKKIMKKDEYQLDDDIIKYTIDFSDCHISKLVNLEKKENQKKESEAKAKQDSLTKNRIKEIVGNDF